jgi:hypothetical protein
MISSVNEIMIGLLRAAKCPACDGSGSIPIQVSLRDWEAEQCRWCYEKDLVLSHFDVEETKEKECKNTDDIPF